MEGKEQLAPEAPEGSRVPFSGSGKGRFRTIVEVPTVAPRDSPGPISRSFAPGKVPDGAEHQGYVLEASFGRRMFRQEPPSPIEAWDGLRIVEEVARVPYRPPVRTVLLMPGDEPLDGWTVVGSWENTLHKLDAGAVVIRVLDEPTPQGAFCIGHPAGYSLPVAFTPGPCPRCVLEALSEGWARLAPDARAMLRKAETAPLGRASGCEPGCTAPSGPRQDVKLIAAVLAADARREQKVKDFLDAAGVLRTLDTAS